MFRYKRCKLFLIFFAAGDSTRVLASGICSFSRSSVDGMFEVVRLRGGTLNGDFHKQFCPRRSFHRTRLLPLRDYYDELGVSKDASASDIKKAHYGKLHTNANKDDTDAERKLQEVHGHMRLTLDIRDHESRRMKKAREIESLRRRQNTASGGDPGGPFDAGNAEDEFSMNDVCRLPSVSLEISFMEAVQGCTKTITFQAPVNCRACGGSGVPPGTRPETCWRCRGSGMVRL
ncbi:unnamed protein product [Musa acuminata subsp. malaccensis]|uniref:(wild Malaysian banana) hypothetical protein n=1 Tax=Musa acuminata subsp. malaccensis TaxID=214687 RepID=A0A8D7B3R5_MUSAM|nr:unnamed protein product [Musa acuminata subsp. malaccensis]